MTTLYRINQITFVPIALTIVLYLILFVILIIQK